MINKSANKSTKFCVSNNTNNMFPVQKSTHRVVCKGSLMFDAIEWLNNQAQNKWKRRGNVFYFESSSDAFLFKMKFAGNVK